MAGQAMTILTGEGADRALNQLAREQMKRKLLCDILVDLTVCDLEGWSRDDYLRDLHELIAHHHPCTEMAKERPNAA